LPNSININRFPAVAYFNLNASQGISMNGHKMQLFSVVNNLFDKAPPPLAIAALNNGGNPYDYIGRTFKLGVRFEW
jgi:outer membrane receptor protein involved in Fe transport